MLAQCVKCSTPVIGVPLEWVTCGCCGTRVKMPLLGQKITTILIHRKCEIHNCRLILKGSKDGKAITECPQCDIIITRPKEQPS